MTLLLLFLPSSSPPVILNLSDSVTITDALAKTVRLNKSDSVTITDVRAKTIRLVKSDSVTITDATAKTVRLSKHDTVTILDSITTHIVKAPGAPAKPDTAYSGVAKPKGTTVSVIRLPQVYRTPGKDATGWGRSAKPDTAYAGENKPTTSY